MTASKVASGKGISMKSPWRKSARWPTSFSSAHFVPAATCGSQFVSPVIRTPYFRASKTVAPPTPQPASSTRIPGRNPQPSAKVSMDRSRDSCSVLVSGPQRP